MEFLSVILAQRSQLCVSPALLARLNAQGAPYGLSLSMGDLHALSDCRTQALQNTGRVEFGEGILEKIVAAFADSPYLFQEEYAEALARLQRRAGGGCAWPARRRRMSRDAKKGEQPL